MEVPPGWHSLLEELLLIFEEQGELNVESCCARGWQ